MHCQFFKFSLEQMEYCEETEADKTQLEQEGLGCTLRSPPPSGSIKKLSQQTKYFEVSNVHILGINDVKMVY